MRIANVLCKLRLVPNTPCMTLVICSWYTRYKNIIQVHGLSQIQKVCPGMDLLFIFIFIMLRWGNYTILKCIYNSCLV